MDSSPENDQKMALLWECEQKHIQNLESTLPEGRLQDNLNNG